MTLIIIKWFNMILITILIIRKVWVKEKMQSRPRYGPENWCLEVYFIIFASLESNGHSPHSHPFLSLFCPLESIHLLFSDWFKKSSHEASTGPLSLAEVISVSSKIWEFFPLACIYYAQMQKENYSSFAIKISLALWAPAFCHLIMRAPFSYRLLFTLLQIIFVLSWQR